MQKLHLALEESHSWYRNWHNHPNHEQVHWGILLLIAAFTVVNVTGVVASSVSDNFNRTTLGSNWTIGFGAMTVTNGSFTSNQTNYPQDSVAFWNTSTFTGNQYAQATVYLPDSSSFVGVAARVSANNGYYCYAGSQFIFLNKNVDGVQTNLASTNSYGFQLGDVIRLDVYGSTIRCLINDTVKLSASDSSLTSGSPGISGAYATHSTTGDNWSAGDWAGAPLSITIAAFPDASFNTLYISPALTASGGVTPIIWALSSGALPAGLGLNSSTGVISGIPSVLGNYSFTVQATDSGSPQKTGTKIFTIAVTQNDIYGGSTTIRGTVTGNWHTQLINGQWWFITPLGNVFHFVAPYNVGRGDGGVLGGQTMAQRINTKYDTNDSNWECSYLPSVVGRLKAWGLTGIGGGTGPELTPLGQNSCWGYDAVLGGNYKPQQYRMPNVFYYQTSSYAMVNEPQTYPIPAVSPLDQPLKNFNYGLNSYVGYGGYVPGAGEPDYSDNRLPQYFDYLIPTNNTYFSTPPTLQSYFLGASIDEADQVFSFTTGSRNPAFLTGWDHSHGGLRALRTSPLQYANRSKSAIYPDGNVYVKTAALRNYLKGLYGTIATLNTAWGSSYSACDMEGAGNEFGSCGTKVTNEIFATASGSSSYTHTLAQSAPSQRSLAVYVDGALVAGDLGYNASDSDIYAAPGSPATTPSKFYGPLVDGSSSATNFINYTFATGPAGTVGIKFKSGSAPIAAISGNGSVVTVKTQKQHGAWPGAHVTISGALNYNMVGAVIGTIVDSYTFTFNSSNTGSVQINNGTASFTDVGPASGASITISYVKNGWGIGNGLMDEDGRHSNCLGASNNGMNAIQLNLCSGGSYANTQIATDLDGVLGQMAADYFSRMNTVFGNHFGNGSSRKVLNLGPDPLIYSASPPAPGVLQAAGRYTDVIALQSFTADDSAFFQMNQAKLDYIRQYAGDKPLLSADFIMAQANSALRDYPPTTGAQNFATQQDRGIAYKNLVQLLTSFAYTGGSKPYVGTQLWQWNDSWGEKLNWGLVTPYDNSYDGREDTTAIVPCSTPLQSYNCGGEQYNSGDFITSLKVANAFWMPNSSTPPSSSDTNPPSAPLGLSASVISSTQINLTWSLSTDNISVAGYKIYRNGSQVATSTTSSYIDTGLTPSTPYSYTVSAYDSAGNESAQSLSVSLITQSIQSTDKFLLNDRVKTNTKAKVRQTPSTVGKALCTQTIGIFGTVIGGPQTAKSFTWWNVNFDSACDGWVAENYLDLYSRLVAEAPAVLPLASQESTNGFLAAVGVLLDKITDLLERMIW